MAVCMHIKIKCAHKWILIAIDKIKIGQVGFIEV